MSERRGRGGGWADFAAVLVALAGIWNGIGGLAAIFRKEYFSEQSLLYQNLQFWGWAWLIVGVLQLIAASPLIARSPSGRILGIILAALSTVVWFFSIGAYPLWSILVIAVDVIVIFGLTAHDERLDLGRTRVGEVPRPEAMRPLTA